MEDERIQHVEISCVILHCQRIKVKLCNSNLSCSVSAHRFIVCCVGHNNIILLVHLSPCNIDCHVLTGGAGNEESGQIMATSPHV